jgi:glycosyltransferase involved in cell wall biosynthesis
MTAEAATGGVPRVLVMAESAVDYGYAFAAAVSQVCPTLLLAPDRLLGEYRVELPLELEAPILDWPSPRSPRHALFLAELHRRIRRWRPDVIHVTSQALTWSTLVLAANRHIPLVKTVHDVLPHPGDAASARTPEPFKRLLHALADDLVVLSDNLRGPAAERFRRPLERVHVLHNLALSRYAALAAVQPRPVADGRFDVLFFGRVYAYKGLDHLIHAAESLADRIPNLRVTIAGAGSDLSRCRELIRTPGLFEIRDRFISGEETAALFARTDVVALPHVEASQSGLAAIATVMAKPMVATAVGDFPESLGGAEPCALIVPPADPAGLAEAIARLHDEPDLRARLGQAGLAQASGPRSPSAIGGRAIEVYGRMLARGRKVG